MEKNYVAKTMYGLESVLAEELIKLGAKDVQKLNRAVSFIGDAALLYKINYCCRTAVSVLLPVKEFEVNKQQDLYDGIVSIPWEKMFAVDCTMVVNAVVFEAEFTNSLYVALRTKDAIVDRFRRLFNQRPSIDKENPEIKVEVNLYKNRCIVSLDSSGVSLFKRGYRQTTGMAPINEVLAAGLIQLAGWDTKKTFYDPMCGSGTLLIEAAMYAANIPAQYYRKLPFAFQFWNDYDPMLWKYTKKECDMQMGESECEIYGSDVSSKSIDMAMQNIKEAKLHKDIQVFQKDFLQAEPPAETGLIVSNPPYGERLQKDDLVGFYQNMGDWLKRKYENYDVWFISSDEYAMKMLGLHPSIKMTLYNGSLECKYEKFEMYKGSKKISKQQKNMD